MKIRGFELVSSFTDENLLLKGEMFMQLVMI